LQRIFKTRDQEPRIKSIEQRVKNKEQRAKNKEQRAKNKEYGPRNTKRLTINAEHRTQNTEHRTQNTEHKTQNTEHGTRNAEHGTRNTEHGTQNTKHGTRNTEHGTQNTERRTGTRNTKRRTQNTEHRTRNAKLQTMTTTQRYKNILSWFNENVPIAETELMYTDPFGLLVAVILSAQCTDKRVNIITPALLADFPTPEVMAVTTPEVIFEYIRSVTYPNSKARHLVGMAKKLVTDFGGKVPDDTDMLQTLPGVGRKTANVIASVVFHKPAMAVDTHVFRISERLGLTTGSKNPLQTELELIKHIPKKLIPKAHHWLILHGRYICVARKPKCEECGLREWCRYYAGKLIG